MSVQVSLNVESDGITPDLRQRAARLANKRPALLAMGQAVVSLAKRAFSDPGVRPATWKARKREYSHAILRRSGDLWKSIHSEVVGADAVDVGSPKIYAAVHQFGSKKKSGRGSGIPPRPYFPIVGKPKQARFTQRANAAVAGALRRQLDAILSN
jgi:phage gpG-like protein